MELEERRRIRNKAFCASLNARFACRVTKLCELFAVYYDDVAW